MTNRERGVGWTTLLAILLFLAACGTTTPAMPVGDAANGERIYTGATLIASGDAPACSMCHAVEPGKSGDIGPNLSNIGNRAATTIEGMPAAEYLRASIVNPDSYLAGGFQEGIHYRGYGEALTPEQVDDLVAYMLTLTSGQDN